MMSYTQTNNYENNYYMALPCITVLPWRQCKTLHLQWYPVYSSWQIVSKSVRSSSTCQLELSQLTTSLVSHSPSRCRPSTHYMPKSITFSPLAVRLARHCASFLLSSSLVIAERSRSPRAVLLLPPSSPHPSQC